MAIYKIVDIHIFLWHVDRLPDSCMLDLESCSVEAFSSWFGSKNATFRESYLDIYLWQGLYRLAYSSSASQPRA